MRITGSLHMTIETAILIETLRGTRRLRALGELQHFLDAGPRRRRRMLPPAFPVFAHKGETLEEYWDLTLRADSRIPAKKVRNSSWMTAATLTLLIHKGYEL